MDVNGQPSGTPLSWGTYARALSKAQDAADELVKADRQLGVAAHGADVIATESPLKPVTMARDALRRADASASYAIDTLETPGSPEIAKRATRFLRESQESIKTADDLASKLSARVTSTYPDMDHLGQSQWFHEVVYDGPMSKARTATLAAQTKAHVASDLLGEAIANLGPGTVPGGRPGSPMGFGAAIGVVGAVGVVTGVALMANRN